MTASNIRIVAAHGQLQTFFGDYIVQLVIMMDLRWWRQIICNRDKTFGIVEDGLQSP